MKMKKCTAIISLVVLLSASRVFAAQLIMNGSTTVLPFGQAAAERFMKENSNVRISVSGSGSGNGFKALADGSAHIANASRFIKDSEIKMCVGKNVYPVPFAVALDCLVPIIHISNPVNTLTRAQLRGIYSGKITNWKDVGGNEQPIVVVGRDTSSGTYDTWQEMIMDEKGKTRVTAKAQVAASSGAMLTVITKNKNAIGYEGMGYVTKAVKALAVEGVPASAGGARSGKYPLSRYLFMFTNGWPTGDTLNFINYMQSPAGQKIVTASGFVSLREAK